MYLDSCYSSVALRFSRCLEFVGVICSYPLVILAHPRPGVSSAISSF